MTPTKTLRTVSTQCASCGQPTPETVLASRWIESLPENQVFDGRLRIVECQVCGLRYLNPMPDPRDLGQIYSYDVYEDSTNHNPVLQQFFHATLVRQCPQLRRVLEIGCGTGEFLAFLESKGLEVAGVEFADSAQRVRFKGKLYVGRMEDLEIPQASFDGVLLLNVIEHLIDPLDVLKKIRRMLAPKGVLLLRHPNSDLFFNPLYRYLVEFPKYLLHRSLLRRGKKTKFTILGFQNQHLFYFDRRSVTRMLDQAGLCIQDYTTVDPYNRRRFARALREGKVLEAAVAGIRHVLGYLGLGPECLIVASVCEETEPAHRASGVTEQGKAGST